MGKTGFSKSNIASVIFYVSFLLVFVLSLLFPVSARAAETLCAEVKIEILQELTLERQAFDAHMRINNGLSHIGLEDVAVEVSFTDEEGEIVLASSDPDNPDAVFFIKVDSMQNIDDIGGAGTIEPSTSADIHWLIIPAPGASNGLDMGTLYYVGARLTYTIGGEEHITEVMPDYIFVKPMPELVLDYFLPEDVYGDDAFTTEIEPPIPFTLGVRVKNNGYGTARELKIDSAQPKIVENDLGLLIGFVIEGCQVNDEPASESLLADFGSIEPNASKVARWIMTCTLSGTFVEFEAEFSHSDELGGELTSLIEEVNTHFLVRDVLVDVQGRDSIRDFLARDDSVYRVYESESTETEVLNQSASSALNGTGDHYTLSTPVTAGFMFVKLSDPHNGQKEINEVIRSDGKNIGSENAWLSKTRDGQGWDYFINLFDANSTGSYTVTFGDPSSQNHLPVLQFIPDRSIVEGETLAFIVEASDPDGTIPSLGAAPLPALADFADQGDGIGRFEWTAATGQAGQYEVTFSASDGVLEDSQRAIITVYSIDDIDGDNMLDTWEMEHFGTLDRDGTGDFDGDGISDLDEFLNGTDPTDANRGPAMPGINAPVEGTGVNTLQPELVILNSIDPDGDTITYDFELYADQEMTNLVAGTSDEPEGVDTTSWEVPLDLNNNTWYFWRVRANDGALFSRWSYGSFFINMENDPPGEIHVSSPRDNIEVDNQTPVLRVTNSVDVDEDLLGYAFEVYADSDMTTLVASASNITEGEDGTTSWVVDAPLDEGVWYYWRVIVTDEHGATAETTAASFLVNTDNIRPQPPQISSPAYGDETALHDLALVVINATDPEDDNLTYFFELDKVNTFDGIDLQASGELAEGIDTTSWNVSALDDNTRYYWRVKVSDGDTESDWALGNFFVNTANDTPYTPTRKNPGQGSWVDTPTPALKLNPSNDPDHDDLTYRFEVYADAALTTLLNQGETSSLEWTVPSGLDDGAWFYWRAQTVDQHSAAGNWTPAASVFVKDDGVNNPPDITILEPSDDLLTNAESILVRWEDNDPDSNAHISLYYDTDTSGEDGILIVEAIEEDPDGSDDTYVWDTTSLPDGAYWLYAVIADEETSVTTYGQASLTIDRTPPTVVAAPPGGAYTSAQNVTLSADEAADIYYTDDGTDPTSGSLPYDNPIEINGNTTLKAMALDEAGNQSAIITETYLIQEDITVKVETSKGIELDGLNVYAFTEAGAYTGRYGTTGADGVAHFTPEDFESGAYKFRIDYLGSRFWSEVIIIPGASFIHMVIEEEAVEVAVTTGSGPAVGVRVYLFSEAGSYLGQYEETDGEGQVSFDLPVGINFTFRADILGSQYWSDVVTVSGGGVNNISLDAGGGPLQVTLEKAPDNPMDGINIYLFSNSGAYLGLHGLSNASGVVEFDVPEGVYKARADYVGYEFWSDEVTVSAATNTTLTIPHQEVEVTVAGLFQGTNDPMEGINVYLFTQTGAYLGQSAQTDGDGKVLFELPEQAYKVRADYLNRQFWSTDFTWQDVLVEIPMADAEITVTGAGFPQEGVNVYVFSATGTYLGLNGSTDTEGKVTFRLAEGTYKFRADYLGSEYWSAEETLTADYLKPIAISTGGGSFTLTVLTDETDPLVGINGYVFTEGGTYLGLFGATNSAGQISFDLADGTYQFRVDYLGSEFWSEAVEVPAASATDLIIEHEAVDVAVTTGSGPAQGVRVYLFSEAGSYLGLYEETDAEGKVYFDLPVAINFTFRADILGSQYWSDVMTVTGGAVNNVLLDAGGGPLQVTLEKALDNPMDGINIYLFSGSGAYLGLHGLSNASGVVEFDVPEGVYKARADYVGYEFWSDEVTVSAATNTTLTIPHQEVEFTVAGLFQGTNDPMEGINVYLFTQTGAYLGQSAQTDGNGKVLFDLPEKAYKVRADYLSRQFWSTDFTWQDVLVEIPMADAEITVTGAGFPREGVNVYVFSATGTYLGLNGSTDTGGKVTFRLAEGAYKFRADYLGSEYWSPEETLTADQVNPIIISTGGGSFMLSVMTNQSAPLVGVDCYVFSQGGTYLGLFGATNSDGQASFDLAEGAYQFRTDYLGSQFWSETINVPATLEATKTIAHQDIALIVEGVFDGDSEPRKGIPVYLFSPPDSYLGLHHLTDDTGQVTFNLPEQPYKVRADYLGQQFWSEEFTWQDKTITIPEGFARVYVSRAGQAVQGIPVYLFSGQGSYLGANATTDGDGTWDVRVPAGTYMFRADYLGNQYWATGYITEDVVNDVEIDIGGGDFLLTLDTGQGPLVDTRVYLFDPDDSYLGMLRDSDSNGQVSFGLADGLYKFRVDHLGYQFWTGLYDVPAILSDVFTIQHQDVVITVEGVYEETGPLAGLNVYLFNPSDAYQNQQQLTDGLGQVVFTLPQAPYKVRADYLGHQFWSQAFESQDTSLTIYQGLADIHVHRSGTDVEGAIVYLFSGADAYLGWFEISDALGRAEFVLPDRSFKFRVDYGGDQKWSPVIDVIGGEVSNVEVDLDT